MTYEPVPSFKYAIFSQTSLSVANNMTVDRRHLLRGRYHAGQRREGLRQHHLLRRGRDARASVARSSKTRRDLRLHGQVRQRLDRGHGWHHGREPGHDRGQREGIEPVLRDVQQRVGTELRASLRVGGTIDGRPARRRRAARSRATSSAATTSAGTSSSQPVPVDVPGVHVRSQQLLERPERPAAPAVLPDRRHVRLERLHDRCRGLQHLRRRAQDQPDGDVRGLAADARQQLDRTSTWTASRLSGDFTLITNAPVELRQHEHDHDDLVVDRGGPRRELELPAHGLVHGGPGQHRRRGLQHLRQERDRVRRRRRVRSRRRRRGPAVHDRQDGLRQLGRTTSTAPGDGALYAQSMDFKNGFNIIYNSRVERVLGFGTTLEQVLWQEINV